MRVNRRTAVSTLTLAALLPSAAWFVSRASVAEPVHSPLRPRATEPPPTDPAPASRGRRYPEAIPWLRLAKQEAESETRPDQKAIQLWQVSQWLNYAGDAGTAQAALTEARTIYRAMKGFERDSGLQILASRMAECGDYPTALETAHEIERPDTRDWALKDVVDRQAKADYFPGIWDAAERIKNAHLKMTAYSAIAEACVRVGDLAAAERAILAAPRELQAFPRIAVVNALRKKGMLAEAEEFERRGGNVAPAVSPEAKVAGERAIRRMRGQEGTVGEILAAIVAAGSADPELQVWMRAEAVRNLNANGRKGDARRVLDDSFRFIEEWRRGMVAKPSQFGVSEGAADDRARWGAGEKLQRMADALYSPAYPSEPPAAPPATDLAQYVYDQVEREYTAIRSLSDRSAALSNLSANWLRWREWERAKRVADRITLPAARAAALIRVGREYGWAGDERSAVSAFNAAELAVRQMGPEVVNPEAKNSEAAGATRDQLPLLCSIVAARKRVGNRGGMAETLQRAESLYTKMPAWTLLHCHNHMAEAFAAAGRFEDAKKAALRCEYAAGRMDGFVRIANAFLPDDAPLSKFPGDGKPTSPMP